MTPKFGENWLMKCIVVFSFWGGGFVPRPPDQGLCPGPRWGHSSQTPIIRSRYRARHTPHPQTLKPKSAYGETAHLVMDSGKSSTISRI